MAKKPMEKMAGKQEQEVTLQIPVSQGLADEIARWAKKMEMTQAKIAKKLLMFALQDPENIGEWLKSRAIGRRSEATKRGWLQDGKNSTVRLAVPVPGDTAQEIEELAVRLNHSTVRIAALLLDFGLADQKWGMAFLSSWAGRHMMSIFGKKPQQYESAEIHDEKFEK